jgi:hypothetical protein
VRKAYKDLNQEFKVDDLVGIRLPRAKYMESSIVYYSEAVYKVVGIHKPSSEFGKAPGFEGRSDDDNDDEALIFEQADRDTGLRIEDTFKCKFSLKKLEVPSETFEMQTIRSLNYIKDYNNSTYPI